MQGMFFGKIHSFDDLHLVLSKVDIPPAQPKTSFVELAGGNGSVDMTEAIGEVVFSDRECSFVFSVLPQDDFEAKKTEVSNALNGRRMKIILDKDPDWYYEGRVIVSEYSSSKMLRKITVDAIVSPFKVSGTVTEKIVDFQADTPEDVTFKCGRMPVFPELLVNGSATVTDQYGNSYNFHGTGEITEVQRVLRFTEGDNGLLITGTAPGTIKFMWREGAL